MADRIYIADKETLDSTHANTSAILATLETQDGKHKNAKRYGIKISKSEPNPTTRVQYIYDAVGMTPVAMDFTNNVFKYGSWENVAFVKNNYPCMVRYDSTEDYKLNPNDYSLKLEGTASDVANTSYGGNAMVAFVGGWISQYQTDTDEYIIWSNVRYDDSYNAWHRTDANGVIREGFYRHIYTPTVINNIARSISGQHSMQSKTATQERTLCKANGLEWDMTAFSEYNYIACLLKIMAKNENTQVVYGNGNMNGYIDNSSAYYGVLAGGTLNNKGQFFGYNSNNQQIKVFHTEAMWGDQFERVLGVVCDKGLLKVLPYGKFNLTGEDYIEIHKYELIATTSGYVKDTNMTEYGRFTKTLTGSATTYVCDYGYLNPTIVAMALLGGDASSGTGCGVGALYSLYAANTARWNIAAGLSCKMSN